MTQAADPRAGRRAATETHYRRFDLFDRWLHGALMTSFLGLSLTGLPLLFHDAPWARLVSGIFGGPLFAAMLHRVFASMMIATFALHLGRLAKKIFVERQPGILWGPTSLVPQPRDLTEMLGHLRYFLGQGPRPRFDRYTYWEKFDYWAVFWGMGIIGGSGLLLWFPEFFGRFVPGWAFNVAMIVHGEEALLAVTFIFTIHFFNGHLRPEKFPMDPVIFTGRVPERELREERPAEWARLERQGRLEGLAAPPPDAADLRRSRRIGATAVAIGLIMVALTIYALLRGH